jgi:cob(I)alamin adenosyltransferase
MRVYTRTGDDGTSGLIGGTRVQKFDQRLEAYGTVDELNSWIGLIRSQDIAADDVDDLIQIQNKLFVIGSLLATDVSKVKYPENLICCDEDILFLEHKMDQILDNLPPLTSFILPGGNNAVSYCHLARTVCRRAERRIYKLSSETEIPESILKYINRLSDYLYVLSRKISQDKDVTEIPWKSEKK